MREKFQKKEVIRYLVYFVFFVIGAIGVIFVPIKSELSIKFLYEFNLSDDAYNTIYFDMGEGVREDDSTTSYIDWDRYLWFELETPIEERYYDAKAIVIETSKTKIPIRLRSLEIYNRGLIVAKYGADSIERLFDIDSPSGYEREGTNIVVGGDDETTRFVATREFMELFYNYPNIKFPIRKNLFFYFILLSGLIFFVDYYIYKKNLLDSSKKRLIVIGICCVIMFVLVLIMALKSKTYGHPDENVTALAIEYYMNRWFPPELNSDWVSGSFSNYGATRLREDTWYYLIAGKVAWMFREFFSVERFFRMLNVILFGVLGVLIVKNHKKNPWMFLAIGLSPQIWYIFSYATSDAWDFFWSAIAIYQLAKKDSMLNRYLEDQNKYSIFAIFFSGLFFSNIYLGKQTYYIILLFSFFILLLKLLTAEKALCIHYLKKYLFIIVAFLLFLGFREMIEQFNYQDTQVIVVKGSSHASNVFSSFDDTTVKLYEQGVSFLELFTEWNIVRKLSYTTVGMYGWIAYSGPLLYYILMYLFLFLCFALIFWDTWKNNYGLKRLETIITFGCCTFSVGLVFYQCWFNDFQAQGRYIFACFLMMTYLAAQGRETLWNNKIFKLSLFASFILGIYSFVFVGLKYLL